VQCNGLGDKIDVEQASVPTKTMTRTGHKDFAEARKVCLTQRALREAL